MRMILATAVVLVCLTILGALAWVLDQREREERLLAEKIATSRLLDESLEKRLQEIDQYRHDLAATVQRLGLERVRMAEEEANGER